MSKKMIFCLNLSPKFIYFFRYCGEVVPSSTLLISSHRNLLIKLKGYIFFGLFFG